MFESLVLSQSFSDEKVVESQYVRHVVCVSFCLSTPFLPAVFTCRVGVSGLLRNFRTGLISSRKLHGLRERG